MTYPTPTEPGFYWAKDRALGWAPVQVIDSLGVLAVYWPGYSTMIHPSYFTWGPRITMPEDLAVEEAGE